MTGNGGALASTVVVPSSVIGKPTFSEDDAGDSETFADLALPAAPLERRRRRFPTSTVASAQRDDDDDAHGPAKGDEEEHQRPGPHMASDAASATELEEKAFGERVDEQLAEWEGAVSAALERWKGQLAVKDASSQPAPALSILACHIEGSSAALGDWQALQAWADAVQAARGGSVSSSCRELCCREKAASPVSAGVGDIEATKGARRKSDLATCVVDGAGVKVLEQPEEPLAFGDAVDKTLNEWEKKVSSFTERLKQRFF
eukprot:TRINITY_DN38453_c0_g1_i1.p1 TRINITY_DN38453_c0_g1~~TRINITY_DN38453_c0_g1_i1.p1  ORF type:complete len:282 (+),score=75.75 TRINITY_DN38453_c0_g1_i1:65-847(+)